MKFRIVKITTVNAVKFKAQRKPWWSPCWITIRGWIQPEIMELPGFYAEYANDIDMAKSFINAFKMRHDLVEVKEEVVYEENQ